MGLTYERVIFILFIATKDELGHVQLLVQTHLSEPPPRRLSPVLSQSSARAVYIFNLGGGQGMPHPLMIDPA